MHSSQLYGNLDWTILWGNDRKVHDAFARERQTQLGETTSVPSQEWEGCWQCVSWFHGIATGLLLSYGSAGIPPLQVMFWLCRSQEHLWCQWTRSAPKTTEQFQYHMEGDQPDQQSALTGPFPSAASGNCPDLQTGNLPLFNSLLFLVLCETGSIRKAFALTVANLHAKCSHSQSWVIQMTFCLAVDLQPLLVQATWDILASGRDLHLSVSFPPPSKHRLIFL